MPPAPTMGSSERVQESPFQGRRALLLPMRWQTAYLTRAAPRSPLSVQHSFVNVGCLSLPFTAPAASSFVAFGPASRLPPLPQSPSSVLPLARQSPTFRLLGRCQKFSVRNFWGSSSAWNRWWNKRVKASTLARSPWKSTVSRWRDSRSRSLSAAFRSAASHAFSQRIRGWRAAPFSHRRPRRIRALWHVL
jgi:hypothetical protein